MEMNKENKEFPGVKELVDDIIVIEESDESPPVPQPQAQRVQFLGNLSPISIHSSSSDDDVIITGSSETSTSSAISLSPTTSPEIVTVDEAQAKAEPGAVGGTRAVVTKVINPQDPSEFCLEYSSPETSTSTAIPAGNSQSPPKSPEIVTVDKAQAEDEPGAIGGTRGVEIEKLMKMCPLIFLCKPCLKFQTDSIMLSCGHHFCYECIHERLIEQDKNCPICNVEFDEGKLMRDNCLQFLIELYRNEMEKISVSSIYIEKMEGILDCPMCFEFLKNPMITKCGHNFCKKCITPFMEISDHCPVVGCNEKLDKVIFENPQLNKILLGNNKPEPEETPGGFPTAEEQMLLDFSIPISDPNEFLELNKSIKDSRQARRIVRKFIEDHLQEFSNKEVFSEEIGSIWGQCLGPAVALKYRLSKSKNQHRNSLILNHTNFYRCFRGVAMVKGGISKREFFEMTRSGQRNVRRQHKTELAERKNKEKKTELEESQKEDD